jgi:hypothetical protein
LESTAVPEELLASCADTAPSWESAVESMGLSCVAGSLPAEVATVSSRQPIRAKELASIRGRIRIFIRDSRRG